MCYMYMCINCQFVPVCKTSSEAQVTALQLCAYIYIYLSKI